jgi:hypothetical protein
VEESLASIRIDGPSFVEKMRMLRPGGPLDSLGKRLRALTIAVAPGKEGAVRFEWAYADEDSAAVAEVTIGRVVTLVKRTEKTKLFWLRGAETERRDPKVVVVRVRLPPGLLRELANAEAVPLDDDKFPVPEN